MPAGETASRITPYIEQLLEDDAARENLRRGADKLRDAYERSQKRRVTASRDEKLRRQLKSAAQFLGDGATALRDDVQKPKKRRRRLLLRLLAVAAIGAGIALAMNDELRASVLGSSPASGAGDPGSPA